MKVSRYNRIKEMSEEMGRKLSIKEVRRVITRESRFLILYTSIMKELGGYIDWGDWKEMDEYDVLFLGLVDSGLSVDEIAERMGVTKGTVYKTNRVVEWKTGRKVLDVKPKPRVVCESTLRKHITEYCRAHPDGSVRSVAAAVGVSNSRVIRYLGMIPQEELGKFDVGVYPLVRKTKSAWRMMISRCEDPKNISYRNYGARGVSVYKPWRDSFEKFWEDVGLPPSMEYSIDRVDNNGHYEPGNVRWATRNQQNYNKRTTKIVVTETSNPRVVDGI